MKTEYIATLKTAFNPFHATSRVPRLFLSLIPSSAHKTLNPNITQLPRTSTAPAILELGFKDGKTMKYSWTAEMMDKNTKDGKGRSVKPVSLTDIVEEVDRHTRRLARKEDLAG